MASDKKSGAIFRKNMRNYLVKYRKTWYNGKNILTERRILMPITYKPLWKLLVDNDMSKADLRKIADIAPNTMTKLRRNEAVSLDILCRICAVLECDFGDIISYVKTDVEKNNDVK